MNKEREALKLALEALEFFEDTAICQADIDVATEAITAIKEALAQTQEPVTWGVDWGKAGDIPCVSIIKRLPDGGSQIMAVEYAPYSYTTPPKQEPVRIMGFNCKCGRRMEVSAEQGVVPAPQRTWVGLTESDVSDVCANNHPLDGVFTFARAIEAKLKEKNT